MRRFPALLTFAILTTFSFRLSASIVVRVGASQKLAQITHSPEHPWDLGESACYQLAGEPKPRCGDIIMTTAEGALLAFITAQDKLVAGTLVKREYDGAPFPSSHAMSLANKRRSVMESEYYSEMIAFYQELGTGGEDSTKWETALRASSKRN